MMRRMTLLACVCVLPALAGLAKAAIAPATTDETTAENAFVLPGETQVPAPVPLPPPATTTLAPSSEPPPTSANPLWAIPLSALTATRDRPLFSASRRPPPPAVAPVAIVRAPPPPRPAEPEKPSLVLVGTIVGDPDSFGIFIDQTSKSALRLRVGEQHDGWTLRSVQKREATLVKDQQSALVAMPQPGKGGDVGNETLPPSPDVSADPDAQIFPVAPVAPVRRRR
jgi:general secretion pathway protein N